MKRRFFLLIQNVQLVDRFARFCFKFWENLFSPRKSPQLTPLSRRPTVFVFILINPLGVSLRQNLFLFARNRYAFSTWGLFRKITPQLARGDFPHCTLNEGGGGRLTNSHPITRLETFRPFLPSSSSCCLRSWEKKNHVNNNIYTPVCRRREEPP